MLFFTKLAKEFSQINQKEAFLIKTRNKKPKYDLKGIILNDLLV